MGKQNNLVISLALVLAFSHFAMASHAQYDEEAREVEKIERQTAKSGMKNPAIGIAHGVKEATVDSTSDLISETAEAMREEPPVLGTLEGARVGGAKAVEHAVKGALKVATLGYADSEKIQVEQPKANTTEVTKYKISF